MLLVALYVNFYNDGVVTRDRRIGLVDHVLLETPRS
jgi:hypothetical protein